MHNLRQRHIHIDSNRAGWQRQPRARRINQRFHNLRIVIIQCDDSELYRELFARTWL
jgi:hypothetical protein